MANVVITIRIMPVDTDTDISEMEKSAITNIKNYSNNTTIRIEKEPIAFGLIALKIIFSIEENKNIEVLENSLKEIPNVSSVEVIDVRRAIG